MIVTEITRLAHAHRVQESILVLAVPCILIAAKLSVARWAHVLGVVLTVDVRAFRDLHHLLGRVDALQWQALDRFRGALGHLWDLRLCFHNFLKRSCLNSVLRLLLGSVNELLLNEILEEHAVQLAWLALGLALLLVLNDQGQHLEYPILELTRSKKSLLREQALTDGMGVFILGLWMTNSRNLVMGIDLILLYAHAREDVLIE
jgi:hypothetical protein